MYLIIVYLWYSLHKHSGLSGHLDFWEQGITRDQLGAHWGPLASSPRLRSFDAVYEGVQNSAH